MLEFIKPHKHDELEGDEKVVAKSKDDRIILLRRFISIGLVFGIILIIQDYFISNYVTLLATLVFVAALAADLLFIIKSKNYRQGSLTGVVSFAALIIFLFLFGDGAMLVWIPVFGAAAFLLLGPHRGFTLSMSLFIIVSILFLLNGIGALHIPFPSRPFNIATDFLASIFILFLFLYLFEELSIRKDEDLRNNYNKLVGAAAKEKSVFSTIEMGLAIADKNGLISFINTPGLKLLDAKLDQVIGKEVAKTLALIKDGKDLPLEMNPLLIPSKSGETVRIRLFDSFEMKKLTTGTFPVGMNITYSEIDPEDRIIVIFFDLTAEKRIDELKDAFLSSMQHQIATPFAIIRWNMELLSRSDEDIKKSGLKKENIWDETRQAIDRVTAIQDNILTASRIEKGFFPKNVGSVDMREVIDQSLKDILHVIDRKKLSIRKRYHQTIDSIMADRTVLTIIVQNLLTNAVKYSPAGETITIKLEQDQKDVILEVSDNGIGIPREDQDRIFNKFFRARNATSSLYHGTGLGLYITKILVEHLRGRIWIKSAEGEGSTFYVSIPKKMEFRYVSGSDEHNQNQKAESAN